ncbi:MAG: hypothetical protein EOO13_08745 [Chitinophagaceae bacterium]|nr:MAG: hypothetical protein EOO13_08745 [Chitinophagaceae bacterium]
MKQILCLFALAFSVTVNAQEIKLNKGQKITISSNITQDVDMGVAQVKNTTNATSIVEVKDADGKNYSTVYKMTKFAMSANAMGQEQNYDSEKPEDKDSEIGKSIGDKINKEIKVSVDKKTGKAISEIKESPEKSEDAGENPFAGMMDMIGAGNEETAVTESAFFLIPAGKKVGDSWTDSVKVKDAMTGFKTYTIKAITANETVVSVFSKMDGKQNVDLQGMQVDIALSAKTEGEFLVDTKTSIMKKSSRVADITGNMDMMGQSLPLTAKMTEITTYN